MKALLDEHGVFPEPRWALHRARVLTLTDMRDTPKAEFLAHGFGTALYKKIRAQLNELVGPEETTN